MACEKAQIRILDETITAIEVQAREHVVHKLGHMTWAEAVVVMRHRRDQLAEELNKKEIEVDDHDDRIPTDK